MEINGHEYHLAKLDAMTQFHVARRLAPVIASMAGDGDPMEKLLNAVGHLSDEDSEYVIGKCLKGCRRVRSDGKGVAPIYNGNGQFQFDDIGIVEMVQLTMATLEENLSGFFTGLRSALPQAEI